MSYGLRDMAADVANLLGPIAAEQVIYRIQTSFNLVASGAVSSGATSITFSVGNSGQDRLLIGDTFTLTGRTYTVSSDSIETSGTLVADISITLMSGINSGAVIPFTRNLDIPVTALYEQVSTYDITPGVWCSGDCKFTLLDLPDDITPTSLHRIVFNGKVYSVQTEISRDFLGAPWVVRAK